MNILRIQTKNKCAGVFFVLLIFLSGFDLMSQSRVTFFNDIGQNNVSNGLYIKTGSLFSHQFGKNCIETGFQFDLKSNNKNIFSGYNLKISRQAQLKYIPFNIHGFYLWVPFSDVLRETNWGILLDMKRNHFVLKFGTGFRTFAIPQKAFENYGINTSSKIHENWNLLYSFGYNLKSLNNLWNIGLSVTNIDHFIINQETNPVFNLRGQYKARPPLDLFIESWYKSAGAFNLSVNYFGFFIRTGIVWDIQ